MSSTSRTVGARSAGKDPKHAGPQDLVDACLELQATALYQGHDRVAVMALPIEAMRYGVSTVAGTFPARSARPKASAHSTWPRRTTPTATDGNAPELTRRSSSGRIFANRGPAARRFSAALGLPG